MERSLLKAHIYELINDCNFCLAYIQPRQLVVNKIRRADKECKFHSSKRNVNSIKKRVVLIVSSSVKNSPDFPSPMNSTSIKDTFN